PSDPGHRHSRRSPSSSRRRGARRLPAIACRGAPGHTRADRNHLGPLPSKKNSPRTRQAHGARLVFWMMKEIDENIDDTSGMQFLGSRWRGEFLSFRPLPGSWLRLGAEVDVDVLE